MAGSGGTTARPRVLKRSILHLRSSRSLAGPERHLLELAPGLLTPGLLAPGYGVEVGLLYRRRTGDPLEHPALAAFTSLGVPAFQVDDPERAGGTAGRTLAERLQRGDVAALHGHDPKADWVIARAARRSAAAGSIRRFATLHLHTRETPALRLYRRLDLALVRRFDGVIAVSAAVAAELAGQPGKRGTPCRVIPNGMDDDRLRARAKAALPGVRRDLAAAGVAEARPLLVAAGRLTRQKGFDLLLEALPLLVARHPRLALVIAGEGPERAALGEQARRLQVGEQVRFLGERADLPGLLAVADLFVLPSRSEGSPYVLLEAMAIGLPVVAAAVGDVALTLGDEAEATTVPPGDPAALAEAILRQLASPDEAKRRSERLRERLAAGRSAARMAEETAAFYARFLGDILP
jgi:glycosyltransferase involved in cell wall biosynthesis